MIAHLRSLAGSTVPQMPPRSSILCALGVDENDGESRKESTKFEFKTGGVSSARCYSWRREHDLCHGIPWIMLVQPLHTSQGTHVAGPLRHSPHNGLPRLATIPQDS